MNNFEEFIKYLDILNYEKIYKNFNSENENELFIALKIFNTELNDVFINIINHCIKCNFHFTLNSLVIYSNNENNKIDFTLYINKDKVTNEFYEELKEKSIC